MPLAEQGRGRGCRRKVEHLAFLAEHLDELSPADRAIVEVMLREEAHRISYQASADGDGDELDRLQ